MATIARLPREIADTAEALVLMAAAAASTPFVGSRRRRWGATDEEAAGPMPGDDLVPSRSGVTRTGSRSTLLVRRVAVARPDRPGAGRLLQLPDSREHVRLPHPQRRPHRPRAPDARRPATRPPPPQAPALEVAAVAPPESLVLHGAPNRRATDGDDSPSPPGSSDSTRTPRKTRLLIRGRSDYGPGLANRLFFGPFPMEPILFVMSRKMMLGIKELAEALQPTCGLAPGRPNAEPGAGSTLWGRGDCPLRRVSIPLGRRRDRACSRARGSAISSVPSTRCFNTPWPLSPSGQPATTALRVSQNSCSRSAISLIGAVAASSSPAGSPASAALENTAATSSHRSPIAVNTGRSSARRGSATIPAASYEETGIHVTEDATAGATSAIDEQRHVETCPAEGLVVEHLGPVAGFGDRLSDPLDTEVRDRWLEHPPAASPIASRTSSGVGGRADEKSNEYHRWCGGNGLNLEPRASSSTSQATG